MGLPKAMRSLAYFTDSSIARRAIPTEPAATGIRVLLRVFMAIEKPSPISPRILALGTRTFSKINSAV